MSSIAISAVASRSATAKSGRIAALDGWRGVAILLVLFDHVTVAFFGWYPRPWLQTGQHGVTIFFVLSGFLITSKLLEGRVSLKRFYLRRFFRLMPAAWTYLAALTFLTVVTGASFTSRREVLACVLFYRNFAAVHGWALAGHYWSLSIEEQFYLVWPSLLVLVGTRRSLWIAAGGAIGCALFRFAYWSRYARFGTNVQTQVRADALLAGCAVALLLGDPRSRPLLVRCSRGIVLPAAAILITCIARFHSLPPLVENVAIAALICTCILNPTGRMVRSLSWRPLAWLGIVSYSVYIWQELFMHLGHSTLGKLISICIALPAFALGSYFLIERPFTRIGHRLTTNSGASSEAS